MRQIKVSHKVTNRDNASINKYLQEIGQKSILLTADEEVALAKRIKEDNDETARNKLVNANLRFVVSVAKNYPNSGLELGDLISEGNIGLIKAAERFDETRGFKFISYAVWRIRQSMLIAISEHQRTVRIPMNKTSQINKINTISSQLEQKFEREPSSKEVQEALFEAGINMHEYEISFVLVSGERSISLDKKFAGNQPGGSDQNSLYDTLEDLNTPSTSQLAEQSDLILSIKNTLAQLKNEKEIDILISYFGLNGVEQQTLDQIGARLHITRERVRQIKEHALRKIRLIVKTKPGLAEGLNNK